MTIARITGGSFTTDSLAPIGLCLATSASSTGSVTVSPWNQISPVSSSTNTAGHWLSGVSGTVKAGQIVVVTMNNSGAMAHEFLLFSGDRTSILNSAKYALALAQSHNPNWDTDPDIANTTLDEYTGYHDSWTNLTRYGCTDPTLGCVDHDVDPDATFLFWFVINTPGTYFFGCHQVDTTAIPWMIHQDKGMWGTIVVS